MGGAEHGDLTFLPQVHTPAKIDRGFSFKVADNQLGFVGVIK